MDRLAWGLSTEVDRGGESHAGLAEQTEVSGLPAAIDASGEECRFILVSRRGTLATHPSHNPGTPRAERAPRTPVQGRSIGVRLVAVWDANEGSACDSVQKCPAPVTGSEG